jgi:hypothetical protein
VLVNLARIFSRLKQLQTTSRREFEVWRWDFGGITSRWYDSWYLVRFARSFMISLSQTNYFWTHAVCFTCPRHLNTLELTRASLPSLIGCAIPFLARDLDEIGCNPGVAQLADSLTKRNPTGWRALMSVARSSVLVLPKIAQFRVSAWRNANTENPRIATPTHCYSYATSQPILCKRHE